MKQINDLYVPKTFMKSIEGFGGYSLIEGGDGKTLCRAENISDSVMPAVCPRGRRAILGKYGNITAAYADNEFVRIENGVLLKGESEIPNEYFSEYHKHKIFKLGDYYTVLPTGIYCNENDVSDSGAMMISYDGEMSDIEIETVDSKNNVISEYTVLGSTPPGASDGDLWAKPKEDGGYEMKIYEKHKWYPYESYVRMKFGSFWKRFKIGDVIECTGAERDIGKHIKVCRVDENGIYFEGAAPLVKQNSRISLIRKIPYFQQVTVHCGRIVGVYSGYDENGKFVSRAYASALNNPFSWSEFDGALSADISGDGMFTAIVSCRDDVVAFTENSIVRLKISGDKITFSTLKCEGVKLCEEKSAVCIDGTVYYKGRSGIYAYDGSFSRKISDCLGERALDYSKDIKYTSDDDWFIDTEIGGQAPDNKPDYEKTICHNPAGACNGKYYIRLEDKKGKSNIFVYNTAKKSWSIEDDPGVLEFINKNGSLIAVCKDGDGSKLILWDYDRAVRSVIDFFAKEGYPTIEGPVGWFFETGKIFADIKKGMYPSRVFLRANLKAGGSLNAGCIYNGASFAERIVSISDKKDGYFEIPIPTRKCESVSLLVFGRGEAEILGYDIEFKADGE